MIEPKPSTYGMNEGQLVPLEQEQMRQLIRNGQALLDTVSNISIGTVQSNEHRTAAHLPPIAPIVLDGSYDQYDGVEGVGFRLLWWSRSRSVHEDSIVKAGGYATASLYYSHVQDPYDPSNVGVTVEDLFVRRITHRAELLGLLGICNKLRPPRGYKGLKTREFTGTILKKLFMGVPLTVYMPVERTVRDTGECVDGRVYFDPAVFHGRRVE